MKSVAMETVATPIVALLTFATILPSRTLVSAFYFPQSDLSLRLPYLVQSRDFEPKVRLFTLRTLRNDSTEPQNTKYRISTRPERIASIEPGTQNVLLHSLPEDGTSGTIIVQARETDNDEAVMEIKVHPIPVQEKKKIDCKDYAEDICFWKSSRYRIYENQPITMIGTFGPPIEAYSTVCPNLRDIQYTLVNGTDYFHVVSDVLYSNASLDRDIRGPPGGPGARVDVQVRCVVREPKSISHGPYLRVLTVDILDQDDNPPVSQTGNIVRIERPNFTQGDRLDEKDLVVKDADTRGSNRYTVHLLEDVHDVLNFTYDVLPIENPKYPDDPASTAILTRIYSKTTLLPKSPYRVVLLVKDESLLPGYGNNSINVTLLFVESQRRVVPTAPLDSESPRPKISYPETASVAPDSPRYSRVVQPRGKVRPDSRITFALRGSKAFSVTENGGIVYVANSTLLPSKPTVIPLKLEWRVNSNQETSSTTLRINVTKVSSPKSRVCNHSCANADSEKKCVASCGVGGGMFDNNTYIGRCIWRSNNLSPGDSDEISGQMSVNYATCSPDLTFCPDRVCDELERLDSRICPQDCTIEHEVHFADMNKGGRGIERGLGTCWCNDVMQCTCIPNSSRSRTGNNVSRNAAVGNGNKDDGKETNGKVQKERENDIVVSARKASSGPCGPICMVGIIGATFFVLLMIIVASFIIRRYRMTTKGARRGCKHRVEDDSNATGILPSSDYVDRGGGGDGLLIGLDTFTMANRHLLLLPKTRPPDPKWEFPRSRLTIERVLGEGEFGRVLRAKAIDIGGWPGPMTVAVKTLKEDACASELADLLSEYQLLKEAQHPNVIRLLGACTTSGGPVYLIIEYAEFGSLRNYLRRSRHLEMEGRTQSSLLSASPNNGTREEPLLRNTEEENSLNYTVTPRDILSFAWQISKGMAYLADIKLVHRDLAARNVLLATGKVCKISDFGLTRDVYEDDAYLKRSKGRVPVKWMAPESLADHVYTSKSDVWSFGVLLWELVTLGASPYPGVDVHDLYNLLKAGYRMERPANCSPQLYKMMVSCWHEEPAARPSFKELTRQWEQMLEDGVEYLDLNPRTVHNQAYFSSLRTDIPTIGSGDDDPAENKVNISGTTDTAVNYLGKVSCQPPTKCDKVDKLQAFWQRETPPPTIASFPDERSPIAPSYANDRPNSPIIPANDDHYESPIKLRNSSVTSNTENDQSRTVSNERPRSYIDMQGKKSQGATEDDDDLLVFANTDSEEKENNTNDVRN